MRQWPMTRVEREATLEHRGHSAVRQYIFVDSKSCLILAMGGRTEFGKFIFAKKGNAALIPAASCRAFASYRYEGGYESDSVNVILKLHVGR